MKANEGGRVKQHAAWRQGQWRGLRHAVCLPQALPATSEKWEPSPEMSRIGDLNEDGVVDQKDYDILAFQWGLCECCVADLNGDGVVNMTDLLLMDVQPVCQLP